MRRVTSPPTVGDVTTSLHGSPTISQYSVEWPTYLEVVVRIRSSVDSPIAISDLTRARPVCTIDPLTTSFYPAPSI